MSNKSSNALFSFIGNVIKSVYFKINAHLILGLFLSVFSDLLHQTKTDYSLSLNFISSTLSMVGMAFVISAIVMLGFTVITPFIAKEFENSQNDGSLEIMNQNDSDNTLFEEYFVEISKLNKKMKKEQEEIEQIKTETYRIAFETQEALSILRSKVGMN